VATPVQSAVILPVPEAEPVIGAWRARFDRSAAWGVPAHVTLLFPFVTPAAIDTGVTETLAGALRGVESVAFELRELQRFQDGTLYLAPNPDAPLRDLAARVAAAFPAYPPYGGAIADPDPHVTVAEAAFASQSAVAESAIVAGLPIRCRIAEAWLMAGPAEAGGWSVVERFALDDAERGPG
jgi:2'-5' RNA ligase